MEGVTVDKNNSNKTSVTCLTTHLTSFAVLVSIHDGRPLSTGDKAISIISYIGCAISLFCLCESIVILTYVLCKSKKNINLLFIHLNLCIALALGLAVFIAGIERATGNQINSAFLMIALKVIAMDRQKLKRAKVDSNGDILKGLLKALIVLLPLLGVTWIIGILAVNDNTLVFAWIFAILNSLQISSNGSTNASQKRASQKTHGDTGIHHSRTLTGMGHFDSILERKRNWLRKSEIHSDSACKDNQVKLTAISKKDLVIELCNVSRKDLKSDKIDSGGDKESKKSINIGEDNPATISVKPDLAVTTAMPISTI